MRLIARWWRRFVRRHIIAPDPYPRELSKLDRAAGLGRDS